MVDKLTCTHNIEDLSGIIIQGNMTICRIESKIHYFILIEWEYESKQQSAAFSYVPESTYNYVNEFYKISNTYKYVSDENIQSKTLYGYIPFFITKSHIVDTWKLTDKFIRVSKKKRNKGLDF